jgi:hypothetical protein
MRRQNAAAGWRPGRSAALEQSALLALDAIARRKNNARPARHSLANSSGPTRRVPLLDIVPLPGGKSLSKGESWCCNRENL